MKGRKDGQGWDVGWEVAENSNICEVGLGSSSSQVDSGSAPCAAASTTTSQEQAFPGSPPHSTQVGLGLEEPGFPGWMAVCSWYLRAMIFRNRAALGSGVRKRAGLAVRRPLFQAQFKLFVQHWLGHLLSAALAYLLPLATLASTDLLSGGKQ